MGFWEIFEKTTDIGGKVKSTSDAVTGTVKDTTSKKEGPIQAITSNAAQFIVTGLTDAAGTLTTAYVTFWAPLWAKGFALWEGLTFTKQLSKYAGEQTDKGVDKLFKEYKLEGKISKFVDEVQPTDQYWPAYKSNVNTNQPTKGQSTGNTPTRTNGQTSHPTGGTAPATEGQDHGNLVETLSNLPPEEVGVILGALGEAGKDVYNYVKDTIFPDKTYKLEIEYNDYRESPYGTPTGGVASLFYDPITVEINYNLRQRTQNLFKKHNILEPDNVAEPLPAQPGLPGITSRPYNQKNPYSTPNLESIKKVLYGGLRLAGDYALGYAGARLKDKLYGRDMKKVDKYLQKAKKYYDAASKIKQYAPNIWKAGSSVVRAIGGTIWQAASTAVQFIATTVVNVAIAAAHAVAAVAMVAAQAIAAVASATVAAISWVIGALAFLPW
jgi:hypothetical protein